MSATVFLLFANCLPVRGARRSTICDLQRHVYHFIPNGLYEILTEHRGKTLEEIKAAYGNEFDQEIEQYFAFLLKHELGFWCDDPAAFPPLNLTWDSPSLITNAVIDVDSGSRHDFKGLFRQLDELGCEALQIRFFDPVELPKLEAIIALTSLGGLRSIDLLMPFVPGWTMSELEQFCVDHPRVSSFQVHSAPESAMLRIGNAVVLSWHQETVKSSAHCGQVRPGYFVTDIRHFTESLHHNSCLNRKISVDVSGEIRNCPSMPKSFGNAQETSLHSAVTQNAFRELWEINKDQIEVCKDCELRYLCTDCRAFIRRPDDRYSKPAKCGYDPSTAQWSEIEPAPEVIKREKQPTGSAAPTKKI